MIALIVVLVLLSLPVMVSMGAMDPCPACPGGVMLGAWGLCLAVLALFTMLLPGATTAFRLPSSVPRPRLTDSGIERPPRSI
jgi:predicted membrane protein